MPSASHVLAARAAEVISTLALVGPPPGWVAQEFAANVDLVRCQLGPLRDRRMLIASYERESTRLAALRSLSADPAASPTPIGPVDAAYAVRWLELANGGRPLPAWLELLHELGQVSD